MNWPDLILGIAIGWAAHRDLGPGGAVWRDAQGKRKEDDE